MIEFFRKLFDSDFMAHGYCFLWKPYLVWLHVSSDAVTAASYYMIPVALIYLVRRRRDLVFHWMILLFSIFILACGTTHLMAVWTLWHGTYRLEGVIKAITAIASFPTAILLIRLVPEALKLPSPAQLRLANEALEREIQERKRAEQEVRQLNAELERRVEERTAELQRATEQYRSLANAMPQIVWTARGDGVADYYNRRWYEYTGLSPEQVQAEGWGATVHPDDLESVSQAWDAALQTGRFEAEYRLFRGSDSTYRWHLGRAVTERNKEGRITKWYGTITDIEDQKRTEIELRIANEDLNQFAYAASHDLQEPLRVASLYSQMIWRKYGPQLDGEAKLYLNEVVGSTRRMHDLLHDVLAYTRLSDSEGKVERVSADRALSEVLKNLKKTIIETGAHIEHEPLPDVWALPVQLVQVLQNLVSNAIKYSRGTPKVHISATRNGAECVFSVSDKGIGIAPEYQEQIFKVFRRLHRDQYPGTGMGLAICARIVKKVGGRIWVESDGKNGSIFRFTWPAA